MKNVITVSVDTDKDPQIVLSKPMDIKIPETKEEAAKMLLDDVATLSEAIKYLIQIAHINGYYTATGLIASSINLIREAYTSTEEHEYEN
jgi:hypothetical protein